MRQDLGSGSQEGERGVRESEERYRSFVEQSTEGIWRFELEEPIPTDLSPDEQVERFYRHGYLAECNDAMARMYGYARAEEIVGARLGDLLPSSIAENVEYLKGFVRSGYRLTDAESVEVDREGRRRHFLNNLVGAVEGGRVLRAWGTQRDATAMKEAEEAMRRGEERYRSLVEATTAIVWNTPASGEFESEQPGWSAFTGQDFEQLKGWGWLDAVHPDDRGEVERLGGDAEGAAGHRRDERDLVAVGERPVAVGVLLVHRVEQPRRLVAELKRGPNVSDARNPVDLALRPAGPLAERSEEPYPDAHGLSQSVWFAHP